MKRESIKIQGGRGPRWNLDINPYHEVHDVLIHRHNAAIRLPRRIHATLLSTLFNPRDTIMLKKNLLYLQQLLNPEIRASKSECTPEEINNISSCKYIRRILYFIIFRKTWAKNEWMFWEIEWHVKLVRWLLAWNNGIIREDSSQPARPRRNSAIRSSLSVANFCPPLPRATFALHLTQRWAAKKMLFSPSLEFFKFDNVIPF